MIDLKLIAICVGASFSIGALSSWWLTADYKEAKYTAAISQMKLEAASALHDATLKAMEVAQENSRLANELEVVNAQHRKKLDETLADNRRLVSELGGLYDGNAATSNCPLPSGANAPSNPPATASGAKLSNQLAELLLSESRRADEAAAYARTCYEWVKKIGVK